MATNAPTRAKKVSGGGPRGYICTNKSKESVREGTLVATYAPTRAKKVLGEGTLVATYAPRLSFPASIPDCPRKGGSIKVLISSPL